MESNRSGTTARRARGAVVAAARHYREAVRRFEAACLSADQGDEDAPSTATIDALGEAAEATQSALFAALDELDALGG